MKLLEKLGHFDFLNHSNVVGALKSQHSNVDDSNIEAYGIGGAMPADVVGFVFAKDNRSNIHWV